MSEAFEYYTMQLCCIIWTCSLIKSIHLLMVTTLGSHWRSTTLWQFLSRHICWCYC